MILYTLWIRNIGSDTFILFSIHETIEDAEREREILREQFLGDTQILEQHMDEEGKF